MRPGGAVAADQHTRSGALQVTACVHACVLSAACVLMPSACVRGGRGEAGVKPSLQM